MSWLNFLQCFKKQTNNKAIYDYVGYNYRMPSVNAALGISQLKKISFIKKEKLKNFFNYKKNIQNNKLFKFMYDNNDSSSNYWLNYIIFNNQKLNKNFSIFLKIKKLTRKIWTLNSDGNFYKKYLNESRSIKIFI